MSALVKLEALYGKAGKDISSSANNEVGNFNIFRIEDILLPDEHKKVTYTRRDFFKVSLVSGHSIIHYADKSIEVTGSVLVFTNPMIPYFWERKGDDYSGFICVFTAAFFSRFGNITEYPVFALAGNGVIPLKSGEVDFYKILFQKMYLELQGSYAYKYDLLRNLLMEIIHEGQKMQPVENHPSHGSNASERITGLFTELLERQFPIELSQQVILLHTPADFARQLNIHVNHLNKALKENTGQTTSQLISQRILQEARILLRSTSWTITEIAWSLGFEEANHFSGFFKTRTGSSPKQFRQAID